MRIELRSGRVTAGINTKGAELASLKDEAGTEYIWQADAETWPRHAPVLFPIVGRLKNDQYTIGEKQFVLGQHGFARDLQFSLVSTSDAGCTLVLEANQETRRLFPFEFKLFATYLLKNSTLTVGYRVENHSDGTMWFSLGAHPGFNCPLFAGERYEDYFLEFDDTKYHLTALDKGLRTDTLTVLQLDQRQLPLSTALFDKDALVFEGGQINGLRLCSRMKGPLVQLNCPGWPFFGIWTKKGCDQFVCLEPWFGVADHTYSRGELAEKTGITALLPGHHFEASYSIAILR